MSNWYRKAQTEDKNSPAKTDEQPFQPVIVPGSDFYQTKDGMDAPCNLTFIFKYLIFGDMWAEEITRDFIINNFSSNENVMNALNAGIHEAINYLKENNLVILDESKIEEDDIRDIDALRASDLNTSPDELAKLSRHQHSMVRDRVANNRNTPAGTMYELLETGALNTLISLAYNEGAPADLLDILATNRWGMVKEGVAKNNNTRPETLLKLAGDIDLRVRNIAIRNPNTPREGLDAANAAKKYDILFDENAPFSDEMKDFLRTGDVGTIIRVLRNKNVPVEVLIEMSKHKNKYVREEVAKNPKTPPDVLVKLSKDSDEGVKIRVANNRSTPATTLDELANSLGANGCRAVAYNPLTWPKTIDGLVKRKYDDQKDAFEIHIAASLNPNTPGETLAYLYSLHNDDYNFVLRITENNNAHSDLLLKIYNDNQKNTHLAKKKMIDDSVLKNKNAPKSITELYKKSDDIVLRLNALKDDMPVYNFTRYPDNKEQIISAIQNIDYSDIEDLKIKLMSQKIRLSDAEQWIDINFDEDKDKFLKNLETSQNPNVSDISGKNYKLFPFDVNWDYYEGYWDNGNYDYESNLGWDVKKQQIQLKIIANDLTRQFLGGYLWEEFITIDNDEHGFGNDVIAWARMDILDDGRINVTELQSDKVSKTRNNKLRNKLKHWDIALWKVISDYKHLLNPSDGKISIVPSETQKNRWKDREGVPTIGDKAQWIYDRYARPERELKDVGTESGPSPAYLFAKRNLHISIKRGK